MLRKGFRKHLYNPIVGLLPYMLYLLLHLKEGVDEVLAIAIPLVVAIIGQICIRLYYKTRMYSLTFYVSITALVLTLIFWAFTHKMMHAVSTYIVFSEIMIVALLTFLKVSKVYIGAFFFRKKNVLQKAWLNEFYHLTSIVQFGLTAHLLFCLIHHSFSIVGAAYTMYDVVLMIVAPILILCIIGAYDIFRTSSMASKLRKEEWLPIVTEKGEVTGKIAKSVSTKMGNKFMHPIVRVALVCNGKVYLQERSDTCVIDAGKVDYPFEKYMLFEHEINLAARNSISRMMGNKVDVPIKFLLKYILDNEHSKRLVLLFVANLDDESKIKRKGKMKGKFWTVKQIEESFADEIFSESFELEFEYLKNTVLEPLD